MLTYSYVTDIVRHSDELDFAGGSRPRGGGVVLLDPT